MQPLQQIARFSGPSITSHSRNFDNLVFLHLEKCAGQSTKAVLESVFGAENVSPHINQEDLNSVNQPHRVISGHFDRSAARSAVTNFQWFTILREPVQRIVSLMNYWTVVASEKSWFWRDGSDADREAYLLARIGTFEAFVSANNEKIHEQVHNIMCRRITGELQNSRSDEAYADLALEALCDDALFFGLQEQFHLSILQIPILLTLPDPQIELPKHRSNVTKVHRIGRQDIGNFDASVIRADMLFYAKAKELFEQRMHAITNHVFTNVRAQ